MLSLSHRRCRVFARHELKCRVSSQPPSFSPSLQFTMRQMTYVRSFNLSSAYTPQAVVGGSREMVGSRAAALRAAIAEESNRKPEGSVRIAINGATANVHAETPQGRDLIVVV